MASQGPNSPGTASDDSSIGTLTWNGPTYCFSNNNTYSYIDDFNSGTIQSHYLKATNFGFSVPSGATIDGIVVEIELKGSISNAFYNVKSAVVKLVKGGTISGNNKGTSTIWPSSDTYVSYGGSSDLWGLSLTDGDVNSSNFGVALSATLNFAGKNYIKGDVDHIRITVYYTAGSGGGSTNAILYIGD